MMTDEDFAKGCGYRKKRQPLLRKHIPRPAVKPGLGAAFLFLVARPRQIAKYAVGYQAEFVVVVKDDAAVIRDAKVLEQQIAGKYIACGQIAQGIAVVDYRGLGCRGFRFPQEQIQWAQAPLDVAVFDDEVVAL